MNRVHIVGMHGLGDNFHQRSVIRELKKTREVWLETPWPCLYHDMPDVKLLSKGSRLRTQAKNARRESSKFYGGPIPLGMQEIHVSYPPIRVIQHGSVLAAMSDQCGVPVGDFRMDVPQEWLDKAAEVLAPAEGRPVLVYRPLVVRKEWGGNERRNPLTDDYAAILKSVREGYWVISIADLQHGEEWMVSHPAHADLELHNGELDVETIVGIFALADLVYTGSGFAVPMAQAVGTSVVSIFGGYESSWSFSAGARFSPYLGIDSIKPCACFSHKHDCYKRVDVPEAISRINQFIGDPAHA